MRPIRTVGIAGCGVIGASWAAFYLARGFDVRATDPAPGARARLSEYLSAAWPALEQLGLAPGATPDRIEFDKDPRRALQDADFVQENGPERLEAKRAILSEISAVVGSDVIIASSSSGLLISKLQDAALGRVLIGHPFNPPHLLPLVEVVGGLRTSEAVITEAMRFYRGIGKQPIHLRQEMKGHLANRLQAALWREAFSIVARGAATVADVDLAIAEGPGLRWGLSGPFLNMHISGGPNGIRHYLDHLGPAMESWWADLGDVALSRELNEAIVEGVAAELSGRDPTAVAKKRDALMLRLLLSKREDSGG